MAKTIVKLLFGSYMYGTNHADSDKDYKTVVMPTAKEILLQKADFSISESTGNEKSRNGAGDVDNEDFSIMRFLKLAAKGETLAIDMLHAPDSAIIESSTVWKTLVENRSMFYTKNMKAYIGYVRKQAAKYGVKGSRLAALEEALEVCKTYYESQKGIRGIPKLKDIFHKLPVGEHSEIIKTVNESVGEQIFYEVCGRKFQDSNRVEYVIQNLEKIYDAYGARAQAAKENDGIDWKALHHALRAGYQAKYIYIEGGFSYPLPETPFLMDVKLGKLDYLTEVQPVLDDLVDEVMKLSEESDYPEHVDMQKVENMILSAHTSIIAEQFAKDAKVTV